MAWIDITSLEFPDDGTPKFVDETDFNKLTNNVRDVHERIYTLEALLPGGIPLGGACLWYGLLANLPTGWVLCDGLNNTLNLLDRFLMGASSDAEVDEKGGGSQHSHGLNPTNTSASHTHTSVFETSMNTAGIGIIYAPPSTADKDHHHHYSLSTDPGGAHSHGMSSNGITASLPPYKRLYWITRTVS